MRRLVRILLLGRDHGFRARLRRSCCGGKSGRKGQHESGAEASSGEQAGTDVPEGFVFGLKTNQLAPGEMEEFILGDTPLAIANVDGEFFAVSNRCPHAGGPIGDGALEGHTVTCPYHGWSYNLQDGSCFVNDEAKLTCYEVKIVGDSVCVRV
ncbi:MAG: Rieske (2Fe-2S) protein [Proteobacteria bacterium]|nr:Rieske (2Fe-2S) protein [Pseudomonadota bacterium]